MTQSPALATGESRSIRETAARFAGGGSDPSRETQRILQAIDVHPDKAIFTKLTPDRALVEAAASTQRHAEGRALGPLDGIAIAWKDLFDFAGLVTTAGSRILDDGVAKSDAALLSRLVTAGAVTIGRTNMTEFAFSGIGLNPHYGTPVNPWSRDEPRVPGGSSSGSAVAVAAGLVPAAIGTDTGGSVRIPAAFNGIVGFKASGGRWPMAGTFPLSPSLDTLGVFCHTVADAQLVDAVARGVRAPGPRDDALQGLRIIVPTNVVFDEIEPAVGQNFEASLRRLEKAGARIERRPMPVFDEIRSLHLSHGALVNIEAYALHRERLASPSTARMDQRVFKRLMMGASIGAEAEEIVRATRRRLMAEAGDSLAGPCVVAYPTVAHTAPPIAALEADEALFSAMNAKTLRNTLLGNVLDWCGVSIPNGSDAAGLPTGFLLSGGPGRDDELLAIAGAAEPLVRGT